MYHANKIAKHSAVAVVAVAILYWICKKYQPWGLCTTAQVDAKIIGKVTIIGPALKMGNEWTCPVGAHVENDPNGGSVPVCVLDYDA